MINNNVNLHISIWHETYTNLNTKDNNVKYHDLCSERVKGNFDWLMRTLRCSITERHDKCGIRCQVWPCCLCHVTNGHHLNQAWRPNWTCLYHTSSKDNTLGQCWLNKVGFMLGRRLRRRPSIKPTLCQRFVFVGTQLFGKEPLFRAPVDALRV